ncbi:D-beta-hydroxybutyrate dehydrogenase, mitochondrial [Aricia agestis]|uniref:D-beta-hydroxybutyrate dehydrogenase, mitochondrial n=1 Tax=Aricia agestis TaxID=91739 RepID=UPI001C202AE8|nr:D-beta-hydroxybutyrate dehydrogenase, mitochondrial [Aricia agestis]
MSWKRVVAITGCDSGLGWAIAARAAREGLVTVAGMYHGTDTAAALALKSLCAHPCELDVTDPASVTEFRKYVTDLLTDNPSYKLYALVNNAGVMTIGNYEWQTPQIIENTINVNLLGAMRTLTTFLPELRRTAIEGAVKPRIINIASHCGLQPLPGFGPYSASKAGLLALTKALRIENQEFGLKAVSFIPGGFVNSSSLLSNQTKNGKAMLEAFDDEQKSLYQDRISKLISYLQKMGDDANFDSLTDENILETFMQALLTDEPKELYKVESWRYKMFYTLFKIPFHERIRVWLLKRFLSLPSLEHS